MSESLGSKLSEQRHSPVYHVSEKRKADLFQMLGGDRELGYGVEESMKASQWREDPLDIHDFHHVYLMKLRMRDEKFHFRFIGYVLCFYASAENPSMKSGDIEG